MNKYFSYSMTWWALRVILLGVFFLCLFIYRWVFFLPAIPLIDIALPMHGEILLIDEIVIFIYCLLWWVSILGISFFLEIRDIFKSKLILSIIGFLVVSGVIATSVFSSGLYVYFPLILIQVSLFYFFSKINRKFGILWFFISYMLSIFLVYLGFFLLPFFIVDI